MGDLQQYYTIYMIIIRFDLISQYMLNKIVTDVEWFGVTWIIDPKLLESYSAVIENNVLCMYAGMTVWLQTIVYTVRLITLNERITEGKSPEPQGTGLHLQSLH